MDITIERFYSKDQQAVKEFVLGIQNGEFGLDFSANDESDLKDIAEAYRGGGFWTAKTADGEIVGTIGLQRHDEQNAILRKMYVKKELRGTFLRVGRHLYDTAMEFIAHRPFTTLWLDTLPIFLAAQRFYIRNGFRQVEREERPAGYTFPERGNIIFRKDLE